MKKIIAVSLLFCIYAASVFGSSNTHLILEDKYEKLVQMEIDGNSRHLNMAKERKKEYERTLSAYELLRERLRALRYASKALYGFRSPFNQLHGISDDESMTRYLDIRAGRDSEKSEHVISVERIAKAQRFSSPPIDMSKKIPAGKFTISIGNTVKEVEFKGGNIEALKKIIEANFEDALKIMSLKTDKSSIVLLFEMVNEGKENAFRVVKDEDGIIESLNLYREEYPVFLNYVFSKQNASDIFALTPTSAPNYLVENDKLILKGTNAVVLNLSESAVAFDGLTIAVDISGRFISNENTNGSVVDSPVVVIEESVLEEKKPVKKFPGYDTPPLRNLSSVSLFGITIEGESIISHRVQNAETLKKALLPEEDKETEDIPEEETTEETNEDTEGAEDEVLETKANEFDQSLIGVRYEKEDGSVSEAYFKVSTPDQTPRRVLVKVSRVLKNEEKVVSVVFINRNENFEVSYANVVVENKERAETIPLNLIEEASDARIVLNGIPIEKNENNFDGVLEGITIGVKGETPYPYTFRLEPDANKIIDTILAFVKTYNDVVVFLDDTTAKSIDKEFRDTLDEMSLSDLASLADRYSIDYAADITESELRRRLSLLGTFTGEQLINALKYKIKELPIRAYTTKYGAELALLSQIGISIGKPGEGWAVVKKGLLNIDEQKFLSMLDSHFDGIGQLFENDTDGDALADTGLAYTADNVLTEYVQTRGQLELSMRVIEERIKQEEEIIEDEQEKLDEMRSRLISKYVRMNEEIKQMEREQKRMENSLGGQ